MSRGPRVLVVGTCGAGKSALAAQLARQIDAPHIELDAFKHGPNWTERSVEEMRERTAAAVEGRDRWVVDGNYAEVRDLLWPHATRLVWLDYPKHVVMWRVISRSVKRVVTRRELWNGNVSDWRRWGDPEHPIRWAWDSYAANREQYERVTRLPEWAHLDVVRLRQPSDAKALLGLPG
jgi:adenylate kinase family enzyme